ncbi:major facilitator superfamily MFS_1 [Allomeiothermus silvanus DSM 9946]|uniref:Major facilitator superfamily MFS_1 n=1 Tax=Allomeiothermus silvanus (strain ATCC 700542 / DSM 9946 / NBRC 106475 / NCIMB 13440 / VI-R2) TaxID=526227 RepID=D7BG60_ALLS1|nr:major facilitator superfamily MFS_1 [Allomeiothermus silvanus DSM 9946]
MVRWAVLLSGTLLYAALYSTVPLLPGLERLFGSPPGSAGLGISLPFLALVLLSPIVPRLRLPVGQVLGGGLLLVGLFGIAAALAPGLGVWLTARALQGAAAAAVPGLSLALIPQLFPRRSQEMAGLWVAGNVLGGGLGRALGGLLGDALGERLALLWLSLPVVIPAFWLLRERQTLTLPAPTYTLKAWPLYFVGFSLLFINFFSANLLPYRLEALGLSKSQIGGVMLAYLAGIPGSTLTGRLTKRWGEVRALRLAFAVVAVGLLFQLPDRPGSIVLGFVVMMAGLFTAQGLGGAISGRQGSGVSSTYVAAFYLGGTAAGLAYPPFLHLSTGVGLGLAACVAGVSWWLAPRTLEKP